MLLIVFLVTFFSSVSYVEPALNPQAGFFYAGVFLATGTLAQGQGAGLNGLACVGVFQPYD